MRYHIDTIPLWDAFRQGGECPLCTLESHLEEKLAAYHLGGAAMEPNERIATNHKGFCAHHFGMLLAKEQRLPLALVTHTHLAEKQSELFTLLDKLTANPGKKGLFGNAGSENIEPIVDWIETQTQSCIVCSHIHDIVTRYMETIAHMWKTDEEFRTLLSGGQGFCLPHFKKLLPVVSGKLSGDTRTQCLKTLCEQQKAALQRLDGELDWFTHKFDHKNANASWGTSRDALPRSLWKLKGLHFYQPKK